MRRYMYVHKDFYDLILDLCVLHNKNRVDMTKEIADFIKQKYIEEKYKQKYGFKLFR